MSDYDSLHKQCRTLESLFDAKLTSFARAASTLSKSASTPIPSGEDIEAGSGIGKWRDLQDEAEDLLENLKEANDSLSKLSADTENPPSTSMTRAIQRHRDVLQDYIREFRRTKTNAQAALDQANLLTGVRNDIDAYKSSAADSLLSERGHIDSSHRIADEILETAYATRSDFAQQRSLIGGIGTRMTSALQTLPGIDNLLGMIKSRRRRDALILGGVIAVLLFLLLTYMWH